MKEIVFSRIDDRLIHGQVMTAWVQITGATEVVIVDDKVAKDTFMQMVMKSAMPNKIGLKVLTVDKATEYLNAKEQKKKVFILVKTPQVILELVHRGVVFKSLGVGGMGAKPDRTTLYRNISATQEERDSLIKLKDEGVEVFFQVTPDTAKVKLETVL